MSEQQYISFTCLSPETHIEDAQYTLTDGISPGVATVTASVGPGALLDIIGDLTMGIGSQSITIANMVVTDPQTLINTSGGTVVFQVADPRVWWRDGEINGHYNVRYPDNSIDPRTEKTPRELATLLCQQIKPLNGFDVSGLPNTARPEFEWISANPAQELAKLCDLLDCRVCWWVDNTLRLLPYGVGQLLDPSLPSESRSQSFTIKPRPDKIKIVGAPRLYQVALPLEAVLPDVNGIWTPMDDVLYAPPSGWSSEDEHFFGIPNSFSSNPADLQIAPDGSKFSLRDLAQRYAFRAFRVIDDLEEVFTETVIPTNDIPSGDRQFRREHVLPLSSTLNDQYSEVVVAGSGFASGRRLPKPSFALGKHWHRARPDFVNADCGTRIDLPFSTDAEHGIIIFPLPIRELSTTDPRTAARPTLYLYVATPVQDPGTRQWLRYERTLNMPGKPLGTGTRILRQEDIQYRKTVSYTYDPTTCAPMIDGTPTNNLDECNTEADYYLDAAAESYNRPDSASDQIPWIVTTYRIDGAINQITWTMNFAGGCTTNVSRGTQHDRRVMPYKQRREEEQRARTEEAAREAERKAARKRNSGRGNII